MHKFIHRMVLRSAVNAALQRANVYGKDADNLLKKDFKEGARSWLEQFGYRYHRKSASCQNWCSDINQLAQLLTKKLNGKRVSFGVAQKMVSLYLKYLWLLGNEDKKPLFAVLDRGIIKKAKVPNPPNWTSLDLKEYKRVAACVDDFAQEKHGCDGAEWESKVWVDNDNKK
jgi:hypothetical protein